VDGLDWEGDCERCGGRIGRYRGQGGDLQCQCGAIYNIFGQRLRDDLYSRPNPSEWDDEIGDLEGYEIAMLRGEYDG
jgi:hypothetical protein